MDESVMKEISEVWSCNSTKSLKLSLVDDSNNEHDFQPVFTYSIFGDTETVFGYKNLSISLKFDSYSLLPFLSVKWDEKLPIEIEKDPKELLLDVLPKNIDQDETKWMENRKKEHENFTIPGEKMISFNDTEGTEFSVYKSDFKDLKCKTLHSRMEIFVLLFIEAGGYIDDTDEHWEVYILYQTSPKGGKVEEDFKPVFAGYSTVYKYFWYKDAKQHDCSFNNSDSYMPLVRKRISQFFVLPLYQGKHVGGGFYDALFKVCYADPLVTEVLVEDPSEAFDDMRDRVDLQRLVRNGTAQDIIDTFLRSKPVQNVILDVPATDKLPDNSQQISLQWITQTRQKNKMSTRQFDRCLEMILLHYFDSQTKALKGKGKGSVKEVNLADAQKRYRLLVKRRLYLRNRDALDDLPADDRKSKLQETFMSIQDDYRRITEKVDFTIPTEKRKLEDIQDFANKKVKV